MAGINDSVTQNLLPVQAYFNLDGTFNTFIGQNMPFYATTNPVQSGLTITNSTIDSTIIGANSPSTGSFTNITTTTGQVTTSPSGNTDITNKLYVDTVAQGLGPKAACQCGTTANITLSGLQTIDGYTTLAGDRVLVKNQTLSQFNGIYIASNTTWTRATDMDIWSEVPGAYTVILNGGQADTGWVCTATQAGTINVTAMPWVQFSNVNTYFAGTGLTLASNTFSITNTGVTTNTYGSASAVPVIIVNAQGQITSATTTTIAISNTQVSGLGTMSTQNANSVAITGGSINGTTIGASSASTISGTTITATTQFSGAGTGLTGTASGLSIGGNAATATSATSAGSVTNSVTFNSGGTGGTSPITYNGSTAPTISYNTIGAPSTTGTGASGNWGISITGNAATVTNGVYTSGSYSNPTWITSILGSIVSGAVASATTSTNLSGGLAGSLPYQSGAGATTFLGIGSANYVLTSSGTAPQYVAQSTLSVGSASTATTATNLAGGIASQIPYQTAAGTTAFIANGTTGQFLTSNGTGAPSWSTVTTAITITDDTSSATAYYPLFARVTTGTTNTEYTSSTKLNYTPSTGLLAATAFSGSGASLTSLTAGNLSGTIPSGVLGNSTVYIGTTAVALNRASASINLTGTSIDGSAGSATTATTATNATNIAITDNTSSSSTYYPVLSLNSSGNNAATTSSTKLSFVPSTGVLSATSFSGAGTGLTGTASSLSIGGNAATATSATSATSATTATNIAGGSNLQIPYQTASGTTSFIAAPTLASTYLQYNGTGFVWAASSGVGTVTSVGLSLPSIFTVSGSPVITTGTLTGTLATQTANTVFAGPTTGAAATPTFRALVSADIPNNAANTTGSAGSVANTLTIGTGLSGTSYNGSSAVTIANSGVTSIVAGTGISISGGTGAVTVTNSSPGTTYTGGTGISVSGSTITNTAPAVTAGESKAWVKWVGSSGSISASYNVSSVTRNSTGHYTINFTSSLADGNYAVGGMVFGQSSGNGTRCLVSEGTPSSSSFQVFNMLFNGSQSDADASVIVIR